MRKLTSLAMIALGIDGAGAHADGCSTAQLLAVGW